MQLGATMWFTEYSISPSELAIALEERGFESLWASEHSHLPVPENSGELRKEQADVMDLFLTLTAAAMKTTALRLGTGICLVNQRDPIQTAKLVASIDQLSGGRFLFGIGNGWHEEEMRNHGTALATRHQLVQERIEAMRAIWMQDRAEYHGKFVEFGPMLSNPKPVQKPYPPVIVGGSYPYAARCSMVMDGMHSRAPSMATSSPSSQSFRRCSPPQDATDPHARSLSASTPKSSTHSRPIRSVHWRVMKSSASPDASSASIRKSAKPFCRSLSDGQSSCANLALPAGPASSVRRGFVGYFGLKRVATARSAKSSSSSIRWKVASPIVPS